MVNLPNKRISVDSHGSQPYASVEELGGGFSSFGPLPPVEFRSFPTEERETDLEKQESLADAATLPGSRKSFTNQLFKAAHDSKDVDHGDGGTRFEGVQEQDISGIENRGYDSDEELNQHLAKSTVKPGSSYDMNKYPENVEELYAKVDKSKKKAFRKKDTSTSIGTDSQQLVKQEPVSLKDGETNKSKKTLRKTSGDPQGNKESGQKGEISHDPVLVYDERTNL